jgi:hypothetical protein
MSPLSPVRPTANRSSRAAAARVSAPTTVRHPGHPAARRARPAILLAFAVLLVSGCSAGGSGAAGASTAAGGSATPAGTPTPTPAPVATAPENQVPVATVADPNPSAAAASPAVASTAPSAQATPATFTSPFYAYSLTFPAAGWSPQPAQTQWDGKARVDSNGPFVDRATGPGSKLFFVYGAPTDLDLAAWSAKGQGDVNAWHGCPRTAESETDVTIGGSPGRLHAFHCQGLYVLKAFTVRDGFGWAFNQIGPPKSEAADTTRLTGLLAGVEWTK